MLKKYMSNYSLFFMIPLITLMGYLFFLYLDNPKYFWPLDILNLFIHESWHFFFALFWNEFLMMAGGTIMQLLVPILILIYFYRAWDYFASALCFAWIGTNLFYIAMYSSDAEDELLPLFNPTGNPFIKHDWNYMFSELWVLEYTDIISWFFWICAILSFCLSFFLSLVLIVNKFRK